MKKPKIYQGKLQFELFYTNSIFTERIMSVNSKVDVEEIKAVNRFRNQFKGNVNNTVLENMARNKAIQKETLNQLQNKSLDCLAVFLEKDLFLSKYSNKIKEDGFVKADNLIVGNFTLHLSTIDDQNTDIGNPNKSLFLEQHFINVPLQFKKGDTYLPNLTVMGDLYFGIILNRVVFKKPVDYNVMIESVKCFRKTPVEYKDITKGYVEISKEGLSGIVYAEDINVETIISKEETKAIEITDFEGNSSSYPIINLITKDFNKDVVTLDIAKTIIFTINKIREATIEY